MNVLMFLLLSVLVAVAAYLVLRSFSRSRQSFAGLMLRIIPAPKNPVIPGTWGECRELNRLRKNSAVYTAAEDRYRRIIPACTDEESVDELTMTHRTFLSNHQNLNRSLVIAFVCFCFGKIASDKCRVTMANVVRYYSNEVSLMLEVSEVMDDSCVSVLESQVLHGT